MSVQSQIDRIKQNVVNTYAVLEGYGATMPTEQNSDNLAATAATVIATASVEPADDDMPKVFLTGDEFSNMTTDKNEVNMEMEYRSKTKQFHAYILIKYQGRSSLSKPKKNLTIKMYSDEARVSKNKMAFKDWKHETHKYVLKANFIDHTHSRNIIGANLWSEVVESRSDYDTLPEELRNSPRNGAIDGFPIKLYVNGTYQGVYTWNIGKDDWMWGMDEDNPNHVLLCAETNTDSAFRATPCNFRALWSGVDETDWSVEVGTNSNAVKTSLNNLIQFVMDNNGGAFRSGINAYLDVQSAIDYYIHQYVICGLDGLALNLLLGTYDGTVWRCGAYDMDSTFGLWWTGESFVSPLYKCPEDYQEKFGLLWERLEENFWDEMQARYAELRQTVYSVSNMFTVCERFTDSIGSELYAEDLEVYPTIPQGDTNNIKQLRNYIRDRLAYCDEQILNGVPGTSIVLSQSEITMNADPVTLTATVLPSNATDEIMWWTSNEEVATVENGIVTPVSDGVCTIRAKCGSGWAVCNVIVSSSATNVMLLDSTTFKEGYRYSHSSQSWKELEKHCYAIFEVPSGNVDVRVRILDNTYNIWLAKSYESVFLGNSREQFPETPGTVSELSTTEDNGDARITVNNSNGYKYCAIPFNRPSWKDGSGWQYSAELLRTYVMMTVNEEIA